MTNAVLLAASFHSPRGLVIVRDTQEELAGAEGLSSTLRDTSAYNEEEVRPVTHTYRPPWCTALC